MNARHAEVDGEVKMNRELTLRILICRAGLGEHQQLSSLHKETTR